MVRATGECRKQGYVRRTVSRSICVAPLKGRKSRIGVGRGVDGSCKYGKSKSTGHCRTKKAYRRMQRRKRAEKKDPVARRARRAAKAARRLGRIGDQSLRR